MFDQQLGARKKIAIVGGGISGLSAAYYLSCNNDVTLYEAAPRLGGHARTVVAGKNGDQPVDTGFIVFNYATYPYLTRLFKELAVPVAKSEMSFGASIDDGRIEYSLSSLRGIAAQARQRGVAISSIGVDVDYNERVMLALARESNGRHHFVERATDLARVFDEELRSLVQTIAKIRA